MILLEEFSSVDEHKKLKLNIKDRAYSPVFHSRYLLEEFYRVGSVWATYAVAFLIGLIIFDSTLIDKLDFPQPFF